MRRSYSFLTLLVCVSLFMPVMAFGCQLKTESDAAKGERVSGLVEKLKTGDRNVRIEAAKELAKMGPAAKDAVPALVAALKEEDPERSLHIEVSNALEKIGAAAVPALIEALKDREAYTRRRAAMILGEIGPPAKDAVPALVAALKDESLWVRAYAARALGGGFFTVLPWDVLGSQLVFITRAETRGGIGPEARAAIPALIEALEDHNEFVRWHAAQAIGGFGSDAKAAIPTLRRMLEGEKPPTSLHAASALAQLGETSLGMTTLIGMIKYLAPGQYPGPFEAAQQKNREVRHLAVDMLGDLGPAAKDAVPALIEAANQKLATDNHFLAAAQEEIRKAASEALSKIRAK